MRQIRPRAPCTEAEPVDAAQRGDKAEIIGAGAFVLVLRPLMEENLRRAMRISSGDPMIFLQRRMSR